MNRKIVVEIRIRRMRFIAPISEQEFKNDTDNQIKYIFLRFDKSNNKLSTHFLHISILTFRLKPFVNCLFYSILLQKLTLAYIILILSQSIVNV